MTDFQRKRQLVFRHDYFRGRENRKWEAHFFKAAVDFEKRNPVIRRTDWDRLQDGTMLCSYSDSNGQCRAIYSSRGFWYQTIRGYEGRWLKEEVLREILWTYGF